MDAFTGQDPVIEDGFHRLANHRLCDSLSVLRSEELRQRVITRGVAKTEFGRFQYRMPWRNALSKCRSPSPVNIPGVIKQSASQLFRVSLFARQLIQQPKGQSHVGNLAARNAIIGLLTTSDFRDALGNKIGLQQFLAVVLQISIRCRIGGKHLPNTLQRGGVVKESRAAGSPARRCVCLWRAHGRFSRQCNGAEKGRAGHRQQLHQAAPADVFNG